MAAIALVFLERVFRSSFGALYKQNVIVIGEAREKADKTQLRAKSGQLFSCAWKVDLTVIAIFTRTIDIVFKQSHSN